MLSLYLFFFIILFVAVLLTVHCGFIDRTFPPHRTTRCDSIDRTFLPQRTTRCGVLFCTIKSPPAVCSARGFAVCRRMFLLNEPEEKSAGGYSLPAS